MARTPPADVAPTADFVWAAICDSLRGRRRLSNTGFNNMNCPVCVLRGERADRRARCGVKYDHSGIGVSCFNCGFRARFQLGKKLSHNMGDFLTGIGIPSTEVKRLAYRAELVRRHMQGATPPALSLEPTTDFPDHPLPRGARPLEAWAAEGCTDPHFLTVAAYLFGRGDTIAAAQPFYWCPETRLRDRLIVPCYHAHRVVGWIGRLAIPGSPRYHNETPSDLLFNAEALARPSRRYAVLVEGVFDALAIGGVSPLGAKLSAAQIGWLNASGKQIILVADRDRAGDRLIDVALAQGWCVSLPRGGAGHLKWDADVKDCAQAVQRYGQLYTLRTIFAGRAQSKLEVNVRRRMATLPA